MGHPYGWYNLTVNVPPVVHTSNDSRPAKPYLWLGIFCSVGCLVAHERVLIEQAELTADLYRHE